MIGWLIVAGVGGTLVGAATVYVLIALYLWKGFRW